MSWLWLFEKTVLSPSEAEKWRKGREVWVFQGGNKTSYLETGTSETWCGRVEEIIELVDNLDEEISEAMWIQKDELTMTASLWFQG